MLLHDGILSDEQTIVKNAGTNTDSTNYVDLESAGGTIKDFRGDEKANNPGDIPWRLIVRVGDTALTAAVTGAVLTPQLAIHSSTSGFSGGTVLDSKALTIDDAGANYPAGALLWKKDLIGLAWDVDKQYLALNYSVATQNISAGTLNAYLIPASQDDFGDEQAA